MAGLRPSGLPRSGLVQRRVTSNLFNEFSLSVAWRIPPLYPYCENRQLIMDKACWQTSLHDKELWLSESCPNLLG